MAFDGADLINTHCHIDHLFERMDAWPESFAHFKAKFRSSFPRSLRAFISVYWQYYDQLSFLAKKSKVVAHNTASSMIFTTYTDNESEEESIGGSDDQCVDGDFRKNMTKSSTGFECYDQRKEDMSSSTASASISQSPQNVTKNKREIPMRKERL